MTDVTDELDRRLAELRRMTERLSALTGSARTSTGSVRAVASHRAGLSDLVIAPDAAELEGDRLPAVIKETINTAINEANRQARDLLEELRTGAQDISRILEGAGDSAELAPLTEVWADYQAAIQTILEIPPLGSATSS